METLVKLKDVAEQVVLDRRHLHAHPELGFQECETSKFVADRLRGLGLEVRTGIAETGVVGTLRGRASRARRSCCGPTWTRCRSRRRTTSPTGRRAPGVMHACGHDGHTAILLGAAQVLAERRDRLAGTVKLLFQPCEERPPGGAKPMIEEGVLEDPRVDAVFGLHLAQEMPVGTISARSGPIMAAADMFRARDQGQGRPRGAPARVRRRGARRGAGRGRAARDRRARGQPDRAGRGHGRADPGRHGPERDPRRGAAARDGAHLRQGAAPAAGAGGSRRSRSASRGRCGPSAPARTSGATRPRSTTRP